MHSIEISEQLREAIDAHLSQSHVFSAVLALTQSTGCGIGEAKRAIGKRFREQFPDQFLSYRDVTEDD